MSSEGSKNPLVGMYQERFKWLNRTSRSEQIEVLRLAMVGPERPAYQAIGELRQAGILGGSNELLDFTLLNWRAQQVFKPQR